MPRPLAAGTASSSALVLASVALQDADNATNLVSTLIPVAVASLIGAAAVKLWLYSQLEYVTAAMLGKFVPRGGAGATVVQLGGGTRELYYYPKDTSTVICVGEQLNKGAKTAFCGWQCCCVSCMDVCVHSGCSVAARPPASSERPALLRCVTSNHAISTTGLLEQAGVTAAVPTVVRLQPPSDLSFRADATVDAVVCLGTLAALEPDARAGVLAEAARVLRPGRPLVFVEPLKEGGSPLRALLRVSAPGTAVEQQVFEAALRNGPAFVDVQYDVALEGQDPHAVGVALRSSAPLPVRRHGGDGAAQAPAPLRRRPKPAKSARGFSGTRDDEDEGGGS